MLHIDLETMGTGVDAKITEIGAVCGDRTFFKEIDPASYAKYPQFTETGDTLVWRLREGVALPEPGEGMHIVYALGSFLLWAETCRYQTVWANAPTFDCAILRYHFDVFHFTCPWAFWQERDVRTAKAVATALGLKFEQRKNPHNALQDATNQRDMVTEILKNG